MHRQEYKTVNKAIRYRNTEKLNEIECIIMHYYNNLLHNIKQYI